MNSVDFLKKKMFENKILNLFLSSTLFTIVYLIAIYMYNVSFLNQIIDTIHPVLIVWGVLVGVRIFFLCDDRTKIFQRKVILVFIVSTFLSAIFNFHLGFVAVLYNWILICIFLIAVFPIFFLTVDRNKLIAKISVAFVLCTFILSVLALIMYYGRISYTISLDGNLHNGGIVSYFNADGSASVVLFGGYIDSNSAAVYTIISIALSVLLLTFLKNNIIAKFKKQIHFLAVANIISEICYFPLANSRGAYIAVFVSIFMVVLFWNMDKIISKKGIYKFLQLTISILISFVMCVMVYNIIVGVRTAESHLAVVSYETLHSYEKNDANTESDHDDSSVDHTTETQHDVIDVGKFDKENATEGIFGMRGVIWGECYEVFRHNPILGAATHSGIKEVALENDIGIYLKNGKETHNSYIDLVLCTGVVGGAIYFVFLLLALIKIYKISYQIKKENKMSFYAVWFAFVSVMTCAFLLKLLFTGTTITYLMMLILLGYLLSEPITSHRKIK